jgi:hypothetical protein
MDQKDLRCGRMLLRVSGQSVNMQKIGVFCSGMDTGNKNGRMKMRKYAGFFSFGVALFSSVTLTDLSWADSPMTWDEASSLSRWVVPFQTRSFVGVQGSEREKPMTVTPGNRFMCILKEHVREDFRLRKAPLSSLQKKKMVHILVGARDRLIEKDAMDLALIQRFEAEVLTPSVDLAAVGRLNERIGAIEGEEGAIFLSSLKSLQGILSPDQKKALVEQNAVGIPSMKVDLSSAVFFADRILSIRWALLSREEGLSDSSTRNRYLATYQKEREAINRLGTVMTIDNRREEDLLWSPLVDFRALSAQYRKAGPDEGGFWGELVKALGKLNPPAHS